MNPERDIVMPRTESAPPDPNKPGYSKAMLQLLNSRIKLLSPAAVIKEGSLDAISKASAELGNTTEVDRVRFELAAVSAHFIPQVWMDMMDSLKAHNADLAGVVGGMLVPLSSEEIDSIVQKGFDSPENIIQDLTMQTENFFVDKWIGEVMTKAKDRDFEKTEEGGFFARYEQLLAKKSELMRADIIDAGTHLVGTMEQARSIIWNLFRTIPEVYYRDRKPHKEPEPREHEELIHNARTLVASLAGVNPVIAKIILFIINRGGGMTNMFKTHDGYETEFFRLAGAPDGQKILEFTPQLFQLLEAKLETVEAQQNLMATTRCPALYVTGRDGRNLVYDFYDWNAVLYSKYCIDRPEK